MDIQIIEGPDLQLSNRNVLQVTSREYADIGVTRLYAGVRTDGFSLSLEEAFYQFEHTIINYRLTNTTQESLIIDANGIGFHTDETTSSTRSNLQIAYTYGLFPESGPWTILNATQSPNMNAADDVAYYIKLLAHSFPRHGTRVENGFREIEVGAGESIDLAIVSNAHDYNGAFITFPIKTEQGDIVRYRFHYRVIEYPAFMSKHQYFGRGGVWSPDEN
jgi:hypothetical protein